IYNITDKFPKSENYIIIDQFRRAAISICLNISEGYGMSNLQFKRYLRISKASVRECIALITLSRLRGYIDIDGERILRSHCLELSKMLSGLINSLNNSQL
ncbi:MAG: four helix bundle protein, partial [Candidatus Omnitrophica bacterium]|nr:four helix bundle protein [Candidatus Omnitrophota bacterium]